jgi:eukaryotic translation initiation factor 2C
VSPPTAPQSEASSSSQPPEVSEVGEELGQMTIHSEETPAPPPPASKSSLRFPLRPGKGSNGKKCIVKANHFFAELPKKDLHQYDVSSTFNDLS